MAEIPTDFLLFFLEIVPALIYSIIKEKRFVRKEAVFIYGLLTLAFGVTLMYSPLADENVKESLIYFFIVGFVWCVIGFYGRSRDVIFSYKSLAAFEIAVMLYVYKTIVESWSHVLLAGVVLFFVFHAISEKLKKETEELD